MPTATYDHPLFGPVTFKTAHNTWVRGDSITFLSGFDPAEVTPLLVPQLVGIPSDKDGNGPKDGKYLFHKRAHAQVLMVFEELERQDLMKHIKSCAGSFNMRLRKPTSGGLSKKLSNHSFGIAIDLNSDDGSNGGSVAPVAPVFEGLGFLWGKSFRDPMHFEVRTFIDHPRPLAQNVTVQRNGVALELGSFNYDGHVYVDVGKAQAAFGLVRIGENPTSIRLAYGGREKSFRTRLIASTNHVLLTEVAGLLGLTIAWNNVTKTATLS